MDLFSKKDIKILFKKYQIYPSKRLGQNFLISKRTAKKFIEAANIQPDDIVLEIGPGIGNLTQEIAKKAGKVIAVEKDPKMCRILRETLKDFPNVEVIQGDILKSQESRSNPTGSPPEGVQKNQEYKVVGNLPFYLTAPVIRKFLEDKNSPKEIILIIQKEVAQRICAKPPKMNILAVSVQFYSNPKIISYISKKSFWPSPKVDSAIIKIVPQGHRKINTNLFFKIVKAGFLQPRKQLINNLSKGLESDKEQIKSWLLKNNIQSSQRAETLSINQWIKLTNTCGLLNC